MRARLGGGRAAERVTPLKPVSARAKVLLGIAFFVIFVLAWGIATFGGFVSKTFLADPPR